MNKGILVTGSLALDTIKTDSSSVEKAVGGSVIYFSLSAQFFSDVSMVAVAGDDFPIDFLEEMSKKGIDVSNVEIKEGEKSFHWIGSYEKDFNEAETIDTQLGVFATFDPKLSESQKTIDTLFLANIDPELQLSVIEQSSASIIGSDSMNLWINIKKESLLKVVEKSDIIFINETEARLLTGKRKIYEIGEDLLKIGPTAAVVKQGSYGCTLFFKDYYISYPVFPTKNVVDPTGAGDSFAGGFMGYLSSRNNELTVENLKAAAIAGTVMASYNIEGFSLEKLSSLTKEDVLKRYREFLEITRLPSTLYPEV